MSEVQSARGRQIFVFAVFVGVTTLLVALGLQTVARGWTHAQQGAVVGGWVCFCLCLAPVVRRLSDRKR